MKAPRILKSKSDQFYLVNLHLKQDLMLLPTVVIFIKQMMNRFKLVKFNYVWIKIHSQICRIGLKASISWWQRIPSLFFSHLKTRPSLRLKGSTHLWVSWSIRNKQAFSKEPGCQKERVTIALLNLMSTLLAIDY